MNQLDEEKIFYERFWALHRDPVLPRVVERLGIDVFRRSCVLEGFDAFLASSGMRGKRCLEIGTRKGLTAIVLARYFDHVVSVDIVQDPQRVEVAEIAGVADRVEFVTVLDNAEKARVIKGLEFDGAFVDGDHARDTHTDFALVERCGQVLFHEHWDAQPEVIRLVQSLLRRGSVTAAGKWALWRAAA